jgi:hypothetical protein
VQLEADPAEDVPATHGAQATPPGLNCPARQLTQEVEEVAPGPEAFPGLQLVHAVDPLNWAYVPAGHSVHDGSPAAENRPAVQAVQAVWNKPGPVVPAVEDLPAAHVVQVASPEVEYVPAGHRRQVALLVAPVVAEYVPAPQDVQDPPESQPFPY